MVGMPEQHWVAAIPDDRFAGERLYAFETLTVAAPSEGAAVGDPVALVAGSVIFGLGRVRSCADGELVVGYTHRLFDEPRPLPEELAPGVRRLAAPDYARLAAIVGDAGARPVRQPWLVSVALPIEAASRAEAVREFWTYVAKLGPRELPAFVWPYGDELSMQAFVLGEEANLDPEEGD